MVPRLILATHCSCTSLQVSGEDGWFCAVQFAKLCPLRQTADQPLTLGTASLYEIREVVTSWHCPRLSGRTPPLCAEYYGIVGS